MPPPAHIPGASELFAHCPHCGHARERGDERGTNPFHCRACQFTFYFNTASAVAVIIEEVDGRILLIRRGREPAKGKLAMPGGFTDPGETGEAATRREIREELGLELADLTYLGSWPNVYHAGGFAVPVLDLFFRARLASATMTLDPDEVSGADWFDPLEIELDHIAFPSMRSALTFYRTHTLREGDRHRS